VIPMAKPKKAQKAIKAKAKKEVARLTLSDEAHNLLNELAGPNACSVIKAMAPAYSGNPEFNKFKVG
jgi:hypothetical protein